MDFRWVGFIVLLHAYSYGGNVPQADLETYRQYNECLKKGFQQNNDYLGVAECIERAEILASTNTTHWPKVVADLHLIDKELKKAQAKQPEEKK